MNKKILHLLKIVMLGPIYPILSVEGDDSNDGAGNEGDDGNNNNNDDGDQNTNTSENNDSNNSQFNQADVDKIISKRLKQQEKKLREEFEATRNKEKMSDIEKANFERDEAVKKITALENQTNTLLIKSEIITEAQKMNVVDVDAVYQLLNKNDIEIENGKVTGVKEAIKVLLNEKPFLNKTGNSNIGDNQNQSGGGTKNKSFNDILRNAIRNRNM